MARKLYDACLFKGCYQKDGKTKKSYQNIGSVIQGDHGPFLLLDPRINLAAFPRQEGKNMLMVSLFKPYYIKEESNAPF